MEQNIEQTEEFRELRNRIFIRKKTYELLIYGGLILALIFLPVITTWIGLGANICLHEQQDTSLSSAQRIFGNTNCNNFWARWMDGALPAIGFAFVVFLLVMWIKCNLEDSEKEAKAILERRRLIRLKGGKE